MLHDVRLAIRSLLRSPLFSAIAALTLAVGLGATTAVFSVVNGVLLKPLPVPDSERLLYLRDSNPPQFPTFSVSPGNFLAWQQSSSFERLGAATTNFVILVGEAEPERLRVDRATATLFAVLGVAPLRGRYFVDDEDRAGGDAVVVLSEALWRNRFAADEAVIGRTVTLSNTVYTVVGVAPQAVTAVIGESQAWTPMAFDEKERTLHGSHYLRAYGRLRPGTTIEEARADLDRIAVQLEMAFPDTNKGWRVVALPMQESIVAPVREALLLLSSAVVIVLLIVCANVASLMLARGYGRQRELAVRVALGAPRSRIIRELLAEGVVLSLAAGFLGLAIARALTGTVSWLGPSAVPRGDNVALDATALVFAIALSMVLPALFALIPAVQVARTDLRESLATAGRSLRVAVRARTRAVLVSGQIALSVILLIACALLVRTFVRVLDVNPGFDPDNVIVAGLQVPMQKYPEASTRMQMVTRWLERVRALPGVEAVGLTQSLPLANDFVASLEIEGRPPVPPTERPRANFYSVSAGFFDAMGIRVLRGRAIDERDHAKAVRVAVINETFARRFYGDGDPVGRRIIVTQGPSDWREIIGVVEDTKQYGLAAETTLQVYESYQQQFFSSVDVVVRTAIAPTALTNTLRATLQEIDREQPLGRVVTLREVFERSLGAQRFLLFLVGGFTLVAVLLAAIGLYGLVAYSVTQRQQEIGLRVALGATRHDVVRLVVRQALLLAACGICAGSVAAIGVTRMMQSLLFNTSATDAMTFTAVPLALAAIVVAAALIPARHATRVDPLIALRGE